MEGFISLQEVTLIGKISSRSVILLGKIQSHMALNGKVTVSSGHEYFNGDYEVIPKIESQSLETKDKLMSKDVLIKSIPYYEVSNPQGGNTVYIGSDLNA